MGRVGIRGCEQWGWIDSKRLFCQGSFNRSGGVYLIYDATTGRELGERIGDDFLWSPDLTHLANRGNVPHFSPAETKSDSLDVDGKRVYPRKEFGERHLFRSELTWSPDSKSVAVVDHRPDGWLYLIIAQVNRSALEYKLQWQEEPEKERPVSGGFSLSWKGDAVTVSYDARDQTVLRRDMVPASP